MTRRRGLIGNRGHKLPERHQVGIVCDLLIKLIFISESDFKYHPLEHDDMIIDSTVSPTQPILGMSSSPNRRRRPRYSYPVSATEWTEYTPPLMTPQVNFYIDSAGDQSSSTSMFLHGPFICGNKYAYWPQMLLKLVPLTRSAHLTLQCRQRSIPHAEKVTSRQTISHCHQNRNMSWTWFELAKSESNFVLLTVAHIFIVRY
jgi:hypothetical protein